MMLTAGTRLGPYEVGSPLGAGGMGEVYRAWHRAEIAGINGLDILASDLRRAAPPKKCRLLQTTVQEPKVLPGQYSCCLDAH